ncbi:MAG TPA: peroxiredoxin [Candidatus Acidoferrales bacterium]|nr:peroxiredoxin [Candidatus Acidoferrales bacterium]
MKLKIGDKAPDFELPSTGGKLFRLGNSLSANKLVLYFYPKDFTMGCTREACGFRDEFSELANSGMNVIGVSTDSIESHEKFKREHKLPFNLLSDINGEVARLYGVYNSLFKIANRVTFIIGSDGKIASITKNLFAPKAHIRAAKNEE